MTSASVPLAEQPQREAGFYMIEMTAGSPPEPAQWSQALHCWLTCGSKEQIPDRLVDRVIGPIATLQQHERVVSDRDDLQRTFDLQWEADQRAIKRWQDAHPGNDLVWPDRANMVVWLMDQLDAATATFDDEEAGHQDTLRLWQEAKGKHERDMAALREIADMEGEEDLDDHKFAERALGIARNALVGDTK